MRIGTHNGVMHADDVIAVAILGLLGDIEVTRTRDPEILAKCDIVVDVGGGKYDHHGLEPRYRDNNIMYASAGLVWRDYGADVVKKIYPEAYKELVKEVAENIDTKFMQFIDATDNGQDVYKSDVIVPTINSLIDLFNPCLDESSDSNDMYRRFMSAVEEVSGLLARLVKKEVSIYNAK